MRKNYKALAYASIVVVIVVIFIFNTQICVENSLGHGYKTRPWPSIGQGLVTGPYYGKTEVAQMGAVYDGMHNTARCLANGIGESPWRCKQT